MKAIVTQAAALTPPESEKMSTNNPNIKLKNRNNVRLLFTGKSKINKI
ncbi:hypothetical protein [uncultured Psychroserpens sp.]